jgi:hypothetical protein
MGYAIAVQKAWNQINSLTDKKFHSVKFLSDEYNINLETQEVLSLSCNVMPKEHYSILILHYLISKLKGIPKLSGEWISFRELEGGQGYFLAFKKRAIDPIIRKYGAYPENLTQIIERFPAKSVQFGDVGIVIEAFEEVPVLVTLWRGDEEFRPEANILFDRNIREIFCTEDIVVLSGIITSLI